MEFIGDLAAEPIELLIHSDDTPTSWILSIRRPATPSKCRRVSAALAVISARIWGKSADVSVVVSSEVSSDFNSDFSSDFSSGFSCEKRRSAPGAPHYCSRARRRGSDSSVE
jgi:hypothetical protein